jgi:hypothetical protein
VCGHLLGLVPRGQAARIRKERVGMGWQGPAGRAGQSRVASIRSSQRPNILPLWEVGEPGQNSERQGCLLVRCPKIRSRPEQTRWTAREPQVEGLSGTG